MTIAAWMLFALLVSVGLTVAAAALEHGCRALRLPTRFLWFGAIACGVLWPAIAILRSLRPPPVPPGPAVALLPFTINISSVVPATSTLNTELLVAGALVAAWLVVSGVLLTRMSRAVLRVRTARNGWRRDIVDGIHVRISSDIGPAVVGVRHPEIVLPEWTLALDAPLRTLMLRHEVEHRDAGDPLLLFSAALLWALAPWNLALWYQTQRLRLALEMDCDRRVLAHHAEHDRYGRLLITIAQRQSNLSAALAPTLSEPVSQLERRIRAMTISTRRFARTRALAFAVVGVTAIAAACAVNTPGQVSVPAQSPAKGAQMAPDKNAPYYSFQVDKQAEALPDNPSPHYPDMLRSANVDGEVVVQFVVNTDGTVDTSTFRVITSTHALFTQAVRNAVASYKFSPASIQGHAVKQLVQEPFQFSLSSPSSTEVIHGAPTSPEPNTGQTGGKGGTYYSFKVDKYAEMLPDNPMPHYPDMLRAANVSGEVVVQFVVNADGTVDTSTFKVIKSPHELFTQAVRNALASFKFSPASIAGRAIKQLVQEPFLFSPGGAPGSDVKVGQPTRPGGGK